MTNKQVNKTTEALEKTIAGCEAMGWTTIAQKQALAAIRETLAEPDTKSGELHDMKTELWKAEHSGDANEMVADTNPLSVFAKECVLGAYTYDELPEAARLALKRAKKAEPWKCACGANLYINSDGAPTSRLKPVKQKPAAVISESAIGLVKLHANGACLPFGTQLYAAPVQTKDLTGQDLCDLEIAVGWKGDSHDFDVIARAVIAADREKNK